MNSEHWQAYFESNRHRSPATAPLERDLEVASGLRAPLLRTLSRLHLGERGEGRIVLEAYRSSDPCLDAATCRCIDLYIAEEHRHAEEIADLIRALGGSPLATHWSARLFSHGRRLLGLRTKMLTIAAAEVVGVEVYRLIARHAGDPHIVEIANRIALEESAHLRFQSDWLRRVLDGSPARGYRIAVAAWFAVIQTCAIVVFSADHAPLLRATGLRRGEFSRRCLVRCLSTMGRSLATWRGRAVASTRARSSTAWLESS